MNEQDDIKIRRIASLLKNRSSTLIEIRDHLCEVIQEAVADNNVDTLGLLATWFVLISEDITIARFREWTRHGQINSPSEPPTNGRGGLYG